MALNKGTLGTAIGNAFATAHGQGQTSQDIALGAAIADAIDAYIKAGNVVTDPLNPFLDSVPLPVTGQGKVT